MRTAALGMLVALLFPALSNAQAAAASTLDRDAFLSAVAEVETGGNARAVGRRGERGLYQFTRATWQRHSSLPFVEAHNPTVASEVAARHFDWLRERLTAGGREPTVYRLAVAWNAGLNRALTGSAPRSTRDYARRVSNLAGVWRPPTRKQVDAAPEVQVAANAVSPAAAPAPTSVAVALAAPEVVPVGFSLGRPESFTVGALPPEVAETPAEEVTFTLARPETTTAAPPRRFIFATIGD